MDRYTGIMESDQNTAAPADQSEWSYLLQLERQEWEADQQAIAEYESWYLDKLTMEDDAEGIAGL